MCGCSQTSSRRTWCSAQKPTCSAAPGAQCTPTAQHQAAPCTAAQPPRAAHEPPTASTPERAARQRGAACASWRMGHVRACRIVGGSLSCPGNFAVSAIARAALRARGVSVSLHAQASAQAAGGIAAGRKQLARSRPVRPAPRQHFSGAQRRVRRARRGPGAEAQRASAPAGSARPARARDGVCKVRLRQLTPSDRAAIREAGASIT